VFPTEFPVQHLKRSAPFYLPIHKIRHLTTQCRHKRSVRKE